MSEDSHPNYLEPIDLRIECIKCSGTFPFHETVPAYLVSGIIIAYHSAHEGHLLRIIADGTTYEPGKRA